MEARLQVGFGQEELKGDRMIRKQEMERFTVISSKPFDEVVVALKAAIGHQGLPDPNDRMHGWCG
jgi:hypothetical protein